MYEVEAKVWVKQKKEWQSLLAKIKEAAKFEKEEIKEDLYFGREKSSEAVFRLRTKDQKTHTVTTKEKNIIEGIEQSKERSFKIDQLKNFLFFTEGLGFKLILKKKKVSRVFIKKNLSIELNTIENLGNFLEIESLCKIKSEIPQARRQITKIFRQLGFEQKDFEKRPYLEILQTLS